MRRWGLALMAGVCLLGTVAAAVVIEESGIQSELCAYYDKGTTEGGRTIWRSIQTTPLEDGTCPPRSHCVWADVDWDGVVGFEDLGQVNACWGES